MAMFISRSNLTPIVMRFLLIVGPQVKLILEELEQDHESGDLSRADLEALVASGIVEIQTHAAQAVTNIFGAPYDPT